MTSKTILIVDDAAATLKLLASILRNEGYKLQIASTAEALSTLRTFRPDLVLVNVHLPGIDGFEVARRIRQDARLQDSAVVAMTASSRRGSLCPEMACSKNRRRILRFTGSGPGASGSR